MLDIDDMAVYLEVGDDVAEEWRDTFFKNIQISDQGRVRYKNTENILPLYWSYQHNSVRGYLVFLYKNKPYFVHRQVAYVFCGTPEDKSMICRHLNDRAADNRADNLTWGTAQENLQDYLKNTGRKKKRGTGRSFSPWNRI